jgi:hypothetical protein
MVGTPPATGSSRGIFAHGTLSESFLRISDFPRWRCGLTNKTTPKRLVKKFTCAMLCQIPIAVIAETMQPTWCVHAMWRGRC